MACEPATRISGHILLGSGESAPDSALHTLYVAGFPPAAILGSGTNALVECRDSASVGTNGYFPTWVEFDGVRQADFSPSVAYALGGGKAASEVDIFSWWVTTSANLNLTFRCPAAGDLFGAAPANPVFKGLNGLSGGASVSGVDVTLDRTF